MYVRKLFNRIQPSSALSLASRGDMSPRLRFGGMHCPPHLPSRPDAIGSPRGPDPGAAKVCRAGPRACAPSVLSTATCPAPPMSVFLPPPPCFLPSPAHLSVSPSLSLLLAALLPPQSGPIQQRSLGSCPLPALPYWAFAVEMVSLSGLCMFET